MPIVWTQDPAANELLETDPLALLIGMVLDQQVKMEKAFGGPYELKRRLGHLDVRKIASMDPENLDTVFRERPALHRFPGNMARRVQAMCAVVVKDYGGDARSVWRGAEDGGGPPARGLQPPRVWGGEKKNPVARAGEKSRGRTPRRGEDRPPRASCPGRP